METYASTCPYMASEVFNEHYTISSDIFSMGLVMFAICELPYDPQREGAKLMPIAKYEGYKEDGLGHFLHEYHVKAQLLNQKSTSLMNAIHCPSDELELFDSMLQYNHHLRPTANEVLEQLESIERQRSERSSDSEEEAIRRPEPWCCIL